MKYKCENELNTLSFKDFDLVDIGCDNETLRIVTGGGIAKYDNSCNEMLEERYISEAEIRIMDAEIVSFYLEGGKYYNADDVLIKEVADEEVSKEDYKSVFRTLKDGESTVFFIGCSKKDDGSFVYEIAIDIVNDTYWLKATGSRIIIEFDRFMNRVIS